MNYINKIFGELSNENDNISVFDSRSAPFYIENKSGNGLFIEDLIHYTPATNWWNAKKFSMIISILIAINQLKGRYDENV